MPAPHANNLRLGRCSLAGQVYLLTLVTRARTPEFLDFAAARIAVRSLYAASVRRYGETLAHVVMPDHIHWLIALQDGADLGEAVRVFRARVSVGLGRRVWQKGFHDHALRKEEDLPALARYIVANPVRAGLVRSVREYPHWDAIWV